MKIPHAVLTQHTAILGKTGSGKTSTAKLLVEQAVADGHSVCILDPIKSDWWGITSNRDGSGPGLPFQILGGPHGHVPLQPEAGEAVGELVASNKLPLSIIDMSRFGPGGLSKFFLGFAPAIAKKPRRVLYVVLEEAHEFGPKERAGGNDENMLVYWSKRLATAGRVAGIRLVVATQRVQSLHNALLSSCDSMIAHRLTFPADQKPVIDWFAANIGKDRAAEVSGALSTLQTGEGFVGSGEARLFERMKFAKISTFDNTSTPTGEDANHEIKTAPVNAEGLKALLGKAVAEAIENDPKQLKAEVAKLKKQLADALAQPVTIHADKRVEELQQELVKAKESANRHFERHFKLWQRVDEWRSQMTQILTIEVGERPAYESNGTGVHYAHTPAAGNGTHHALEREAPRREAIREPDSAGRQTGSSAARAPAPRASHHEESAPGGIGPRGSLPEGLGKPHQKILNALALWSVLGKERPTRAMVAAIAGYTVTGGSFSRYVSALSSAGLIVYPDQGSLALTDGGSALAEFVHSPRTSKEIQAMAMDVLDNPHKKIMAVLLKAGGAEMGRTQVGELVGYEASGGSFSRYVSHLSSLGFVYYPRKTTLAAASWLFTESES